MPDSLKLPEEAVRAAVEVYEHGVWPGDESEATDIELEQMTLTVVEQFVAALPPEWMLAKVVGTTTDELVAALTEIVRRADQDFEKAGGGTRHWVRDHFLPALLASQEPSHG